MSRCIKCKHVYEEEAKGKRLLICRRYPPVSETIAVPGTVMGAPAKMISRSGYPPVNPDMGCGEWAFKLEEVSG